MEIKLTDAWNLFFKTFIAQRSIASTDKGLWINHIYPFFKDAYLHEITTQRLLEFRAYLENLPKPLSPQSVHHCLSLIRRIFNKMKMLQVYNGNIPFFIMPKVENERIRYLSQNEVQLLLSKLDHSSLWHDITLFALYSGLRAGEIFELRCHHINPQTNSVYVMDTKSNNRVVPLNDITKSIVEKYVSSPDKLLFSKNNNKINEVSKIFTKAVSESGLNAGVTDRRLKVVFHTLRHTFASWLLQKGVRLEVLQTLLGHSDLKTTQRYAHLAQVEIEKAVLLLPIFPQV